MGWLIGAVVLVLVTAGLYHTHKRLLPGMAAVSPWRGAGDHCFVFDQRYRDAQGNLVMQRQILPAMLWLIQGARQRILLDLFLYNEDLADPQAHYPSTEQLTSTLLRQKQRHPQIRITVHVDPINTAYGCRKPSHLRRLESAGIEVLETPLHRLRDSNPSWSALWRLLVAPWRQWRHRGWLPNPVGPDPLTLRAFLTLFNFKANHRKTLVADQGGGWAAMVSSANPHDASSLHNNVALVFNGPAAEDVLYNEQRLADLIRGRPDTPIPPQGTAAAVRGPRLRYVTESRIRDAAEAIIDATRAGERLDLALFYLSHRSLMIALIRAHQRGVRLRILLDPNKDAFGRVKGGVPNRQSAMELHHAGIAVRWYRTEGEQFHCKFLYRRTQTGEVDVLLGSANFTRRNLDDFNLEASVHLQGDGASPALREAGDWFQRCWSNPAGMGASVPYSTWADERISRYLFYRVVERSGWCSF